VLDAPPVRTWPRRPGARGDAAGRLPPAPEKRVASGGSPDRHFRRGACGARGGWNRTPGHHGGRVRHRSRRGAARRSDTARRAGTPRPGGWPLRAPRAGGRPAMVPDPWLVPVGDADALARRVVEALDHPSPVPLASRFTASSMAAGVVAVYRSLV